MNLSVKNLMRSKPIQITLISLIFLIISPYLNIKHYNILYSFSVFCKDILMFILPFSVFSYISTSLIQFKNKALSFIIMLVIFEALSNSASVFYAYGLYNLVSIKTSNLALIGDMNLLTSYIKLSHYRPKYWSADKGAIIGMIVGLYLIYNKNIYLANVINKSKIISNFIFTRIFSPLMPFLIPGFISNFIYNKTLHNLILGSGINIFVMILGLVIYILFLFFVGAKFNSHEFVKKIINALPSMFTAFTTMCSIITMPLTIKNAEKNLDNPKYAEIIIPMTSNIQMIGDCFINAFLCLMLLNKFNYPIPNLIEWSKFTLIFTLVRYAASGVSGGTTFLLLPLYEKYLNFNNEMLAIMLGLNTILDPIITAANVYANGALILVFERVMQFIPNFFRMDVRIYDK